MVRVCLDHYCFHIDNDYLGLSDMCRYDQVGLADEFAAKLHNWADTFWDAMEHNEFIDIETHNRIGLEIAREIKPFMSGYGTFAFSIITSVDGTHIEITSVEI